MYAKSNFERHHLCFEWFWPSLQLLIVIKFHSKSVLQRQWYKGYYLWRVRCNFKAIKAWFGNHCGTHWGALGWPLESILLFGAALPALPLPSQNPSAIWALLGAILLQFQIPKSMSEASALPSDVRCTVSLILNDIIHGFDGVSIRFAVSSQTNFI